jgi:LCP family protein required for cell wall assembly
MSDLTRASGPSADGRSTPAGGSAAPSRLRDDRADATRGLTIWPDEDEPGASGGDGAETGAEPDHAPSPERPHRLRRGLLIGSLVLLALLLVIAGGAFWWLNSFAGKIHRIPDVFSSIPEQQRPDKPAAGQPGHGGLTFLLAGTDRRSDVPTTGQEAEANQFVPGAQRTDTIMLVHLTDDRKKAYVVSIPRDSWVPIPGHGYNKINAAYSFGGPALYVRTIERLTGIRVDHLAVIDWSGFKTLTDAVGGVTVTVPKTVHDSARDRTWTAGTHHLDGDEALLYVRQRHGLPAGDFDRVKRQQYFLRVLMGKALSQNTFTNPLRLGRLLNAVTKTVSVDDTLSDGDLRSLALSLRALRTDDVIFLTIPTTGTGFEGKASVVYVDKARAAALWKAVRGDDLPAFLDTSVKAGEELGDTTP